jgi:hypothetical protein
MSKRNNDLYNSIFWKDKGFFSWKGKTFTQITSSIQKNKGQTPITTTNKNISALFHPNPLKIYRREIASQTIATCNPRTSIKIDEINRPNGCLLNQQTKGKGIPIVLDIQQTTNQYDLNAPSCHTSTKCLSQENNALRRVRSAGMNRTKYNACTNGDAYNANTSQYLKSRHKTFDQNQFVFKHEVAPSYFKPNNTKFKQEGGVDASSLINRKKYDALTKVGSTLVTPLGNKVSNSLAYAVPFENYIKKGKPFPVHDPNRLKQCITQKCIPK